jgi:hypothetical protein
MTATQQQMEISTAHENFEGTDTARASSTETRLGVDDYNDLTYTTLSVTRNDPDPQAVRRHHESDLKSRAVVFRYSTDLSPRAGVRSHRIPRARHSQFVHLPRDFAYRRDMDDEAKVHWAESVDKPRAKRAV